MRDSFANGTQRLLPSGYLANCLHTHHNGRRQSRIRNGKVSLCLRLLRRICFSAISGLVPMVMGMAFDLTRWQYSPRCSRGFQRHAIWR